MKRLLRFILATLMCTAGMTAWALDTNVDGVYEIGTVADLVEFSELVNAGETQANAVLTADIANYTGPVIGTASLSYEGTFDGQGHSLHFTTVATDRWWGLFRSLSGTVKNLRLSGSITTTFDACGGLAAHFNGGTILNVDCGVDIIGNYSGTATYGGVVCRASAGGGVIKNCIFSGSIQGEDAKGCAGIVGWAPNAISLTNCLIAGTMAVNEADGNVIARNPGNCAIQRCYYVNKYGSVPADVVQVTEEQVESGEVCYMLNGDQTDIQWTQTIGTDAHPLPFSIGETVYAVPSEGFRCDGFPQGNVNYSNTNPGMSIPPHTFVDGVCNVCGAPDPGLAPLVDGYYELGTPEQVIWFASMVNNGEKGANARLVDDIDMRFSGGSFPMIGTSANHYSGTFDGQFHTITIDLVATMSGYGFFRYLDGTVKNLHIDGNLEASYNKTGVFAAEIFGATIENCWSSVEINASFVGDGAISGIASRGSGNGSVIRNCLFSGRIEGGAWNCAPILGWAGSGKTTIENCLSTAEINTDHSQGNARPIGRFDSASTTNFVECLNCYYVDPNGSLQNAGAKQVTQAQIESGEVCFLLNGDQSDIEWFQYLNNEDGLPVPFEDEAIVYNIYEMYGNAYDDNAFGSFREEIISSELEYCENVLAQKALVEEYAGMVNPLYDVADIETLQAACLSNKVIRDSLITNAAAYASYIAKLEEVKNYLAAHEELQNEKRNDLEDYLEGYDEPSELHPNGQAQFILEDRLPSTEEITEETERLDQMLEMVIIFSPTPGTYVTRLLVNPEFTDGFNGWQGKMGTSVGVSSSSSVRAVVGNNNTMDMYQTLTGLTNGIYELQVNGAFRPQPEDDRRSTNYSAILYANGMENYFQTLIEDMVPVADAQDGVNCNISGSEPDYEILDDEDNLIGYTMRGIVGCSNAFQAGRYFNSVLVNVTDGTLTVGIKLPGTALQPAWIGFGNIQLIYHGTVAEAGEGFDRVLQSMSARANTMVNVYRHSSGSDYKSYPNFSQSLKNELTAAMAAVGTTTSPDAKYALVEKFSDLFQQVDDCKQAYTQLMTTIDGLSNLSGETYDLLNNDQFDELYELIENLLDMYEEGKASAEEARKDYYESLSFMPKIIDNVYQIDSPIALATFAELVKAGNTSADAVLTADIANYTGPVIGTASLSYEGTFDGQGHSLHFTTVATDRWWGLFRSLSGTVKNLRLSGSITTSFDACGGLAAHFNGGTIQNVDCGVDIIGSYSGNATYGGVVCRASVAGGIIKDCIFSGSIQGEAAQGCAGIVGWAPNAISLSNILIAGTMAVKEADGNVIARNPGNCTIQRCYYVNAFGGLPAGLIQVTEELLANGEVCYMLNGDQTDIQWTQTLGTDAHPLPFPTGDIVYAVPSEGFRCDGLPMGDITYSNTDGGSTIASHDFVNGICTLCGNPNPKFKTLNANGYYELADETDLTWFVTMVNKTDNTVNAVLTADITDYTGPVFGTASLSYDGTFDGQGHNLNYTSVAADRWWGLFRRLGGTVKNLRLTGSITTTFDACGGLAAHFLNGTIQNVDCGVDIISSFSGNATYGGVVCRASAAGGVIKDCVFSGSIQDETATGCAGIVGWAPNAISLSNILIAGVMEVRESDGNVIARNPNNCTMQNCYYVNAFGAIPTDVIQVTEEQLENGEVCYMLNGDQTDIQWTQMLGTEKRPKPFPGNIVRRNEDGNYYNDGTGIATVKIQSRDEIFDLTGRKMAKTKLPNGIYIIDGRKVLIK